MSGMVGEGGGGGCGPACIPLASVMARKGVNVGLVGESCSTHKRDRLARRGGGGVMSGTGEAVCGPGGIHLAPTMAKRGINVGLVGHSLGERTHTRRLGVDCQAVDTKHQEA